MKQETKYRILQLLPIAGVWIFGIGLIMTGCYFFSRMDISKPGQSYPITVLFLFAGAVIFTSCGFLLFAVPYFIGKGSRLVTGLLYPAAWLDNPAPMLSPVQGKIIAGHFEEALKDLQKHIASYPKHATAYLLLADLYKMNLNDPDNARKIVLSYLDGDARTPGDDAVRLVLRNVDYLMEQKKKAEAFEFLRNETQKRCYSANEIQSLLKRLNYISASMKGK